MSRYPLTGHSPIIYAWASLGAGRKPPYPRCGGARRLESRLTTHTPSRNIHHVGEICESPSHIPDDTVPGPADGPANSRNDWCDDGATG